MVSILKKKSLNEYKMHYIHSQNSLILTLWWREFFNEKDIFICQNSVPGQKGSFCMSANMNAEIKIFTSLEPNVGFLSNQAVNLILSVVWDIAFFLFSANYFNKLPSPNLEKVHISTSEPKFKKKNKGTSCSQI